MLVRGNFTITSLFWECKSSLSSLVSPSAHSCSIALHCRSRAQSLCLSRPDARCIRACECDTSHSSHLKSRCLLLIDSASRWVQSFTTKRPFLVHTTSAMTSFCLLTFLPPATAAAPPQRTSSRSLGPLPRAPRAPHHAPSCLSSVSDCTAARIISSPGHASPRLPGPL